MLSVCLVVLGIYTVATLIGAFHTKVVRISKRLPQDLVVLGLASLVLSHLCAQCLVALALSCCLALCLYMDLPAPWVDVDRRAVLVTGCDRGIGRALALHLDKLGFRVFAGCLVKDGEDARTLVSEASDRLVTVQLDVRSAAQARQAAQVVRDNLDGQSLHGVVNNAGVLYLGNVELMSEADIDQILNVNVRGLINVYRAFMPLLRAAASCGGQVAPRLVNVSSNIGLAPSKQMAIYAASKAAVAALSETWRLELWSFGIKLSTMIPSGFKTGIVTYDREVVGQRWWEAADQEVKDYFGRECFTVVNRNQEFETYLNPDFSGITGCMTDALLSKHPRPFYYKGILARSVPFVYLHTPSWLWDRLSKRLTDYYVLPVKAHREKRKEK